MKACFPFDWKPKVKMYLEHVSEGWPRSLSCPSCAGFTICDHVTAVSMEWYNHYCTYSWTPRRTWPQVLFGIVTLSRRTGSSLVQNPGLWERFFKTFAMLLTVLSAACKLNLCISNLDEKYKAIMFETFLSCSAGDWSWGPTHTRRALCRWDTSPVLGKQFWLINSYSLAFLFLIVLSKSPVQENIMIGNCKASLLSLTHCKPVTSLYSARFQQMGVNWYLF